MNLNHHQRELIELTSRYCDGSLDQEQFGRLESLLRSGRAARILYRDFTQLHAEIAWSVGGLGSEALLETADSSPGPCKQQEREYLAGLLLETGSSLNSAECESDAEAVSPLITWSRSHADSPRVAAGDNAGRRRALGWFATPWHSLIAASLLLVLLSAVALTRLWTSAPAPRDVAQISSAVDCRWIVTDATAGNEFVPREGDHLSVGQMLELASGDLTVEFTGGATTTVRGPARLEIFSASAIQLDAGVLVAEVPPRAVGFTVSTPNSRVVDLGTSFVVAVDAKQGTALQVVQGKVELASRLDGGGFSKSQVVIAGQARQVFPGGLVEVLGFRPAAHEQFNWPAVGSATEVVFAEVAADETDSQAVAETNAPAATTEVAEAPVVAPAPAEATTTPAFSKPIWLGNLFDDAKDTTLEKAMETDELQAIADSADLGVALVAGQGAARKTLPPQVTFDFSILGWNTTGGGADFSPKVVNDAANGPLGNGHFGDAIVTKGVASSNDGKKVEDGIGMHANGLITFNLEELRKAAGWQGRDIEFISDRVGLNDKVFGNTSSSIYALAMTTGEKGVLTGVVNGDLVGGQEVSGVWLVRPRVGAKVKPLVADGNFAATRLKIPQDAKFLTLAITSAGDGVAADHAVWSGARLECVESEQATK